MTRPQAVLAMVAVALMWSIAGVVTRQLQSAGGFEMTFWRSAANAAALLLLLSAARGPAALVRSLRSGGSVLWLSAACWCTMYSAFMLALTLTSVANVLVTMALAPLFTALLAWLALGQRLPARTWAAVAVAGVGIGWMYGQQLQGGDARHLLGTGVALAVPVAAAINWSLLRSRRAAGTDMLPAVLLGALLSAALMLPLALPFAATRHDIGLLTLLGVVQLALPCLLATVAARSLDAPEVALLSLLEVVFGVAWVWLAAGEAPDAAVIGGGLLVLSALGANEAVALLGSRRRAAPRRTT